MYGEASSNQLRRHVQDSVFEYKDRMRKTRRKKDKNKGYTPSGAKVTATVKQLLRWKWLERRELDHKDKDKENKEVLTQIPKVYYSLSKDARFALEIGIQPDEDFHLEDAFHAVVSSAATGWDYYKWNKNIRKLEAVNIEGTSIRDIINRRDHHNVTIGKFPRFTKSEIQRAIEIALEKKIVQKKIIDNEVKYVIVENLKEFVSFCWRSLFKLMMILVKYIFLIKRLSNKSKEYKVISLWLSKFYDTKGLNDFIVKNNSIRTKCSKEERKDNIQFVKSQIKRVEDEKKEALTIYEKSIDNTELEKSTNLGEAVIRYVCPKDVLETLKSIVTSL